MQFHEDTNGLGEGREVGEHHNLIVAVHLERHAAAGVQVFHVLKGKVGPPPRPQTPAAGKRKHNESRKHHTLSVLVLDYSLTA